MRAVHIRLMPQSLGHSSMSDSGRDDDSCPRPESVMCLVGAGMIVFHTPAARGPGSKCGTLVDHLYSHPCGRWCW